LDFGPAFDCVSHSCPELHTDILTASTFAHFFALFPEKFNNKTNGVTVRRWINQSNRPLGTLLTEYLVAFYDPDFLYLLFSFFLLFFFFFFFSLFFFFFLLSLFVICSHFVREQTSG
jgi:hypothetical protein